MTSGQIKERAEAILEPLGGEKWVKNIAKVIGFGSDGIFVQAICKGDKIIILSKQGEQFSIEHGVNVQNYTRKEYFGDLTKQEYEKTFTKVMRYF